METLKKILRKIDFFGVNFSFKFNKNETYSTSLGGLFMLIFFIVGLYLGISKFFSFLNRQNFSTIYYTMNISKTEKLVLKDSKASFTFGLECYDDEKYKVNDLFDLTAQFVVYKKFENNTFDKTVFSLATHSCNYEDFYNLHNSEFDRLDFTRYLCLDDKDQVITGIWDDQIFSYYEFSVVSKHETDENLDNIEDYLFNNDCKLQLYYTDFKIDLENYENPVVPCLDAAFIQLNPTLFIKRNIFFMNQYLIDDDYLFSVLNDDKKHIQMKTLYSRYEEYFLYVGLNRGKTKPHDTYKYARVYIRADTKKTVIKRNYQKLFEFYANATSLLIGLYRLLIIIFNYINNFYAENSLSRRIFFFKEFENINNINISKKFEKIKELISLTDSIQREESETNSLETNLKDFYDHIKINNDDIKTFSNNNRIKTSNNIENIPLSIISDKSSSISNKMRIGFRNFIFKNIQEDSKNSSEQFKIKKIDEQNIKSLVENKNENIHEQKIYYSFNIFEIIISQFCKCCLTKKLYLKNKIYIKANNILYNKLDIVAYVRNMILIDIINETLLDDNLKPIINFLCRPLLSIDKNESFSEFYQNYKENDLDSLYNGISELIQKNDKEEREKRLIFLVNKNLKEFIN